MSNYIRNINCRCSEINNNQNDLNCSCNEYQNYNTMAQNETNSNTPIAQNETNSNTPIAQNETNSTTPMAQNETNSTMTMPQNETNSTTPMAQNETNSTTPMPQNTKWDYNGCWWNYLTLGIKDKYLVSPERDFVSSLEQCQSLADERNHDVIAISLAPNFHGYDVLYLCGTASKDDEYLKKNPYNYLDILGNGKPTLCYKNFYTTTIDQIYTRKQIETFSNNQNNNKTALIIVLIIILIIVLLTNV